jgi:23S rRNA (guanosine2251-2'-O)-methyltransferase
MRDQESNMICGRQPVLSAIKAKTPIHRIIIADGSRGDVVDEIFALAREIGCPYDVRERSDLDRIGVRNHQGVIALVAARAYADFDTTIDQIDLENCLLLFLDQIQDPHNLGAILRSACALNVDAVIIPKREACGLTSTVIKVAAGAADHIAICRVNNLQKAMLRVKQAGMWLVGLDEKAEKHFSSIDFPPSVGLVVGNEGKGLRRLVADRCDFLAKIPMCNTQIGSLNVSVATGVALYEVMRQREN